MRFSRRTFVSLAGAGLVSTAFSAPSAGVRTIIGPAFGSSWRACLPSDADIPAARREIEHVIREIDASMSPYRSDSELTKLNKAPAGRWLAVSPLLKTVFDESRQIASMTMGAFDPTVGPVVRNSGFGPISGAIDASFANFDVEQLALRKPTRQTTLDFCGIAKGYALDLMGSALVSSSVESFLLEVGGELLAHGQHPEGRPWMVGIETEKPSLPCRIQLGSGMAIATSGTAHQAGFSGAFTFNHIADPFTREPVSNAVFSVSVIAETALRADALATALVVMGPERGLECAERNNLAVYYQLRNEAPGDEKMTSWFASEVLNLG